MGNSGGKQRPRMGVAFLRVPGAPKEAARTHTVHGRPGHGGFRCKLPRPPACPPKGSPPPCYSPRPLAQPNADFTPLPNPISYNSDQPYEPNDDVDSAPTQRPASALLTIFPSTYKTFPSDDSTRHSGTRICMTLILEVGSRLWLGATRHDA